MTGDIQNEKALLRMSLKDELDIKKVRILELETENGELKTVIETMSSEIRTLRKGTEKKAVEAELD